MRFTFISPVVSFTLMLTLAVTVNSTISEQFCSGSSDINGEGILGNNGCQTSLPSTQLNVYKKDKYYAFIFEPQNLQFVKEYFEERSSTWELVKKTSERPDIDLIYSTDESNWKLHNDHVIFSFWPLHSQFSNKYNFYRNAQKLDESGSIKELKLSDVMLPTYFFDMNQPKFTEEEKEFFSKHKSGVWIKKPVEEARCKGIEVFKDLKEFYSKVGKKKPFKKPTHIVEKNSWIVQKYLENSLLISGKKFDVRCFVLIASFNPYVVLYHPGYVRRSLDDFKLDDLSNKLVHCVNQSVQMKHKHYDSEKEDTIWMISKFDKWLIKKGQDPQKIQENIKKRVLYSGLYQKNYVNSGNENLHNRKFHLFGADISFDDKYNPYIIEFNSHIQLNGYNNIISLNNLLKNVAQQMLDLETQHIIYYKDIFQYFASSQFNQDLSNTDFTLLYNEATNYSLLK